MDLNSVAEKLNSHGFHAQVLSSAAKARAEVLRLIPEHATVGVGGSMTILTMGLHETLAEEGLAAPLVKKYLNRPICSACGKIKRYFFNKAALDGDFTVLATGHNLDDEIARLFSNVLRWDVSYLSDQGPNLPACNGFARKVKPLFRLSEFETANYAFLKGIDYHTAPCPYSGGASFTFHKTLWEDLEYEMPGRKLEFYLGFLERGRPVFAQKEAESGAMIAPCERCGYPTSSGVCGVCRIRDIVAERLEEDHKGLAP